MIRQLAVVNSPSRQPDKLLKHTVFYAKFDKSSNASTQSINSQLLEAKSFIYSHGWRLDEIFIDAYDCNYSSSDYRIKDRAVAVCKSQKNYPPRRFLIPELVLVCGNRRVQKRSAFNDMLLYIRDNPVDIILTTKLEHLVKNLKDLRSLIDIELEPRDIALLSITENFNSDSSEGKQFLTILDSFPEFYSERGKSAFLS